MDNVLESIVNGLIKKTDAGQVKWLKAETPNGYKVIIDKGIITIQPFRVNGADYTECNVTNNRGDIILRESARNSTTDGILLHNLYYAAFNSYTGREDVIKSLLDAINSDDEIGDPDLPF